MHKVLLILITIVGLTICVWYDGYPRSDVDGYLPEVIINKVGQMNPELTQVEQEELVRQQQLLIKQIDNLHRHQTMILHIKSRGGNTDAGYDIINAIKTTRGVVIGQDEGSADSMAGIILIECPEIRFKGPFTYVLFHSARTHDPVTGEVGFADPGVAAVNARFQVELNGILTDEELRIMFVDHKDVTLSATQLAPRLCERMGKACD